jgi:hypothetical protein
MAASSLTIRDAKPEDVPRMAIINVSERAMHRAMYPELLRVKPGKEDQVDFSMSRLHKGLERPSTRHIVVAEVLPDGSQLVVGCAEWLEPSYEADPDKTREVMSLEAGEKERAARLAKLPSCIDHDVVASANKEVANLLESQDCKDAFKGRKRSDMWSMMVFSRICRLCSDRADRA